jgi:hypothetical protein
MLRGLMWNHVGPKKRVQEDKRNMQWDRAQLGRVRVIL